MNVRTMLAPGSLAEARRTAGTPLLALALGLVVLLLLFQAEAAAAVQTWYDSTAYSHCFFVLPIVAWLVWDRREALAGVPIVPLPLASLLVLPIGLAWLTAERLGIMEGRQLAVMAMVEVLFLAVLGWRMFHALLAPLLYLFFLVPFGAFITPQLQDFTTGFIHVGLNVLGIPWASDGYTIEIPGGRFYVAEACAGLRFLIASIAFGVLYACLMYRSRGRRLGFVAASIVIPIIANGFRALGIVVLGYILGSAQAAVADHIIYGWLFFSFVIVLLILAGLPFREDLERPDAPPAASAAPAAPFPLLLAAVVLVVCAAAGPAIAGLFNRAAGSIEAAPALTFATPLGCTPQPAVSAPGVTTLRFLCPQGPLSVAVRMFPPRTNPGRIMGALRQVTGELEAEDPIVTNLTVPGQIPEDWRYVLASDPGRVTAEALWVDGLPARGGLAGRLAMARNSVFGAVHPAVLVTAGVQSTRRYLYGDEARQAQLLITTFLQMQTGLAAQIAALK